PLDSLRLPFAPENDRSDIPTAAFAHNCPVPHYGLEEPILLRAIQAYYACVSFIDSQVGELLQSIDQLGLADDTIVVLWSDHGYHLGEHQGIWQKRTLFEESARSPLIIRVPGRSSGRPCKRIVEFVDIYPTLVDLASIDPPSRLDGRSVTPLLTNPNAAWKGLAVTQVLRPADSRLESPVMGRSIRTERYRYTEWAEGKSGVELYDHHTDPNEFNNLAIDPNAAAMAVMERLKPLLTERASGKTPSTPFNPTRL
ncbi:MAG: sulfatase/phosphatase domain-containing protein, partial [Planctomycetota bacterium]